MELEDEYDSTAGSGKLIQCVGENEYLVNARIELDDLCEELVIKLPMGKYTTLADFVPAKTMLCQHRGLSSNIKTLPLLPTAAQPRKSESHGNYRLTETIPPPTIPFS
ncbi:transporter associated domain-containing protein [Candidatus Vondammii sp. HM_W22]|uniref:transporter associated domain-containing protein n=1 Tax=Candidatus Vondammii sp. HM_W22 TaxID=2687299 RepID=UPI001F13B14B|nr:transporter associated domain-containing protein [Candidatus Vondammii sp. HM_W22]